MEVNRCVINSPVIQASSPLARFELGKESSEMEEISEAQKLIFKAEKKLKNSSSFSLLKMVGLGGESTHTTKEEAAELYVSAGNSFKSNQQWKEAIDAYEKASQIFSSIGEKNDSCNALLSAAATSKHSQVPEMAISFYEQATDILLKEGRFTTAAKNQKEIAEIYENELFDWDNAIAKYKRAGELYLGEDSKAIASGCLFKGAKIAASANKLAEAIELFTSLQKINSSMDNAKWQLKEYIVGEIFCLLVQRTSQYAAKRLAELTETLDPSLNTSREGAFLKTIIESVKNEDLVAFEACVTEMDSYMALDSTESKWKMFLLLKIKEKLENEPSLT